MIIQKKGKEQNVNFSVRNILDIDDIRDHMRAINEKLNLNNMEHQELFNKINELLDPLEEGIIDDTVN